MDTTLIPIILGAVLPPVIDLVNKYIMDRRVRFIVSVVFALIIGAVVAVFENGLDDVLANAGLIFISAQMVYQIWYKESGLQSRIR